MNEHQLRMCLNNQKYTQVYSLRVNSIIDQDNDSCLKFDDNQIQVANKGLWLVNEHLLSHLL